MIDAAASTADAEAARFAALPAPRVRFAPSPTGKLHVGNLRPALMNWLFARHSSGSFLLRFDDTDATRSRQEFVDSARSDLTWLGLNWDGSFRQSDRSAAYAAAAEKLIANGRIYPAYDTEEELAERRATQAAAGTPPIYNRAALRLTAQARAQLEAEGRMPHWRFRLDPGRMEWDDLIRGAQGIEAGSLSDPVIRRADGGFLYTFTSVVDDVAAGITHVIRGEDHVTNTAVQLQLFAALDASPPAFAHHTLLVGPGGEKLAKRLGALSLESLRADGLEPETIIAHMASLGTGAAAQPDFLPHEIARQFTLPHAARAPAQYDPADLTVLNAQRLQGLSYNAVAADLAGLGVGGGEAFWLAVRPNAARLAEAAEWWGIVSGEMVPPSQPSETAFLTAAADALPERLDNESWSVWTASLSATTGRRGKALFRPLRLALTGREAGPEMTRLLPFIGRPRAHARLNAHATSN